MTSSFCWALRKRESREKGEEVNNDCINKKDATGAHSHIECDTLILDDASTSGTTPSNIVSNARSRIEHEATVSKVFDAELFYLMSRGITRNDALQMILMGFIEPFAK